MKLKTAGDLRLKLRDSLRKAKDTKNFTIDKAGRFSSRFFQAICAFACWYFLARQDAAILTNQGVPQYINAMLFFAITSPVISAFLVIVYITPWFSKAWTSRRIITIETTFDT
ncbi:hypothetical protein HK102_010203, partial [Quaeritorhiza haematococci]